MCVFSASICHYKGWVCNAALTSTNNSKHILMTVLSKLWIKYVTQHNVAFGEHWIGHLFDCVRWLLAGKTNCSYDIHAASHIKCIFGPFARSFSLILTLRLEKSTFLSISIEFSTISIDDETAYVVMRMLCALWMMPKRYRSVHLEWLASAQYYAMRIQQRRLCIVIRHWMQH